MEKQHIPLSDPAQLRQLFVHYLNRIYQGKKYLDERLPSVIKSATSNRLKMGIEELLDDVKKQLRRMSEIYALLDEHPADGIDSPIGSIIREACDNDFSDENKHLINDLDLMVHMQLVEHVNIISYRVLRILAAKLTYTEIEQLLLECFDESVEDDTLFLALSDEYLEGK
jgi:ferritin-like metal-binding protein YciE